MDCGKSTSNASLSPNGQASAGCGTEHGWYCTFFMIEPRAPKTQCLLVAVLF